MTDPETIRAVIDRHLATMRTMIAEIEAIRAQLLGETSLVVQEGADGFLTLKEAPAALEAIGRRPTVPTKFYATLVDACRERLGIGKVTNLGPWLAAFKTLHTTCMGNARWAAFVIVAAFQEDDWVMGGCRVDWFIKGIDRLAIKVKAEMSRERDIIPAGPVGLPAEEPMNPEQAGKMVQELLARLRGKK